MSLCSCSSVSIVNFEHVIAGSKRTCQICLLSLFYRFFLKNCFALQRCDPFISVTE